MPAFKYDLHIHSCLSPCGSDDMTPNNIAGMAMLNGVQIAALTDHNTAKNCPAFFSACRRYGVIPIPGMELTTQEEIHMVCLFPSLEAAMKFDEFLDSHRMKIKNRPKIFGNQLILNDEDEVIGEDEYLLITATDLELTAAANAVREHGGVPFPAHIEKSANSVLAMLGLFPEEPAFTAAEIHDMSKLDSVRKMNPILDSLKIISDSDAHQLDTLPFDLPEIELDCDPNDENSVRNALISYLSVGKK